MNENKNNLNGQAGRENRLEVEQFVEALETDSRMVESLSEPSRSVAKFGADVRESASMDLPEASESLREMLLEALDSEVELKPTLPVKEKQAEPVRWLTPGKMAIAACVLLAAALAVILIPSMNNVWQLAQVETAKSWARTSAENGSQATPRPLSQEDLVRSNYGDELAEKKSTEYGLAPGNEARFESETEESESKVLTDLAVVPRSTIQVRPDADKLVLLNKPMDGSDAFHVAGSGVQSGTPVVPPNVQAVVVPSADAGVVKTDSLFSTQIVDESLAQPSREVQLKSAQLAMQDKIRYAQQQQSANGAAAPATIQFFETARAASGDVGGSFGAGGGGFGGGGGGRVGGRGGKGWYSDVQAQLDSKTRGYFLQLQNTGGEQYEPIHENQFVNAKGQQALSTFSIDVDTASYSNMRRFLNNHQRPPRNSVRIEELVNYFEYDYPQPEGDVPFSVNMEFANCPWNDKHHLLRVGLKGKEIHREERSASNLVFLLDVSGSMQSEDKLPLLKKGLAMMIQRLSENDTVSIVTYAGNAGVVLEPTNGSNKRKIEEAIERLNAGGSTNGSAGINMAYELAQKQFIKDGSNRVILATDGDLNVGITSDDDLVKLIKEKASEGVFLTVLGFGTGNLKDGKLEKLADNGNGMYAYIDSFREAHKVLIDQMSGSLETIAKDVKIQIEFNPGEVESYRLIGYENRVLAAQDFDNDKKDAGEIGAGHTVTALYEIVLNGSAKTFTTGSDQPLRYQNEPKVEKDPPKKETTSSNFDGEILTLSLRYKMPDENDSQKIQYTLDDEPKSFSSASGDFQFAAAVASFGMLLRNSEHRGSTSFDWVGETASRHVGDDVAGYRIEFLELVRKAASGR